jgi:hypothetical protein
MRTVRATSFAKQSLGRCCACLGKDAILPVLSTVGADSTPGKVLFAPHLRSTPGAPKVAFMGAKHAGVEDANRGDALCVTPLSHFLKQVKSRLDASVPAGTAFAGAGCKTGPVHRRAVCMRGLLRYCACVPLPLAASAASSSSCSR